MAGEGQSPFLKQYGWLDIVDGLANGDSTKWEHYFCLSTLEIFNLLAFYKAKNAHLKKRHGTAGRR